MGAIAGLIMERCLPPGLYGSAYNLTFWTVVEIIQKWVDAGAPENRRSIDVNFKPTNNHIKTVQHKVLDSWPVCKEALLIVFLFFSLANKDSIDSLHDLGCKFRRNFSRFHVFMYLLYAAGACDDRTHKGVLQTPGERQL